MTKITVNKIKKDSVLKNQLLEKYPWAENEYELLWCVKYNITTMPVCMMDGCDKKRNFLYYPSNHQVKGYSNCCTQQHNMEYTSRLKYGVDNPMKNESVKMKLAESFKGKFGVEHVSKIKGVQDKINQTNLNKYGVLRPLQSKKIQDEIKQNALNSIGVDSYSKITIIDKLESMKHEIIPLFKLSEYKGYDKYHPWKCVGCGAEFDDYLMNREIPRCPVCYPKKRSIQEQKIFNFLISEFPNEDIVSNYRNNENKEADIFLPNKKIGVEINGNYWHSELNGKGKNYHVEKTESFKKENILLIHLFEDEILNKLDIVCSVLLAKLGKFAKRIYARKTNIVVLDNKTKKDFLDNNHLQGDDKSTIKLGLIYDGMLVSVMTFGKSRFSKKVEYEMYRFCNLKSYQVIGAASKLLRHFIKTYNPSSIVTYADRRYSDGSFYEKIGFTLTNISQPNYFYMYKPKMLERKSRIQFQKHKLEKILDTFDPTKTEWENMMENNYDRIWDCGNFVYVLDVSAIKNVK